MIIKNVVTCTCQKQSMFSYYTSTSCLSNLQATCILYVHTVLCLVCWYVVAQCVISLLISCYLAARGLDIEGVKTVSHQVQYVPNTEAVHTQNSEEMLIIGQLGYMILILKSQ